jgi:hypothetical protein
VLVMLLRALLFSQFEAGSVLFSSSHHGSSGGGPVVRSRGSSHRSCSVVSESGRYHLDKCRKSISILFKRLGESADHDKSEKNWKMCVWSHVKTQIVCCVTCQWSPFSGSQPSS